MYRFLQTAFYTQKHTGASEETGIFGLFTW